MLINSSGLVKAGDIVVTRLVDGIDIIGSFVSETDTSLTIKKPLAVDVQYDKASAPSVRLHPISVIHEDEEFVFNKTAILLNPNKKIHSGLVDMYKKTTSPIIQQGIIT